MPEGIRRVAFCRPSQSRCSTRALQDRKLAAGTSSKPVGDPDHLKVFANAEAAAAWFAETTPKAWRLNIGIWVEEAANRGAHYMAEFPCSTMTPIGRITANLKRGVVGLNRYQQKLSPLRNGEQLRELVNAPSPNGA